MDFDVTREQWIERFAMHLSRLEIGALPEEFLDLAARRWETRGQIDAETVAEEEFASRRHAGATATVDFQNTLGLGDDARFERTERIPVERIQTAGEYVRDNDEWIARCVARVLALDPIIKSEEARRSVGELAELERWRVMKPEAAAEQLYTPIRPR
ncbi:MAG TPA: hypothetical protein VGO85_22015 [Caldimonas sp.]|jgi:hypothetical protein|nr:hypothetical protein [Caldimonas sp.]